MFQRTQVIVLIMGLAIFSSASLHTAQAQSADLPQKLEQLDRRFEQLEHKLELDLKVNQVQSEIRNLKWFAITLTSFVAFFVGIYQIYKVFKVDASERRAVELHNALLHPTAQTVILVNETLRLANIASERSTTVLVRIVEEQMALLDADVFKFIKDNYTPDIRSIIDSTDLFSKLQGLIERFNMFEAMNSTLSVPIILSKNCFFIKGMAHYRNAQYDDALYCWGEAASRTKA